MTKDEAIRQFTEMVEMYKSLRINGEKLRTTLNRNQELIAQVVLNIRELGDDMDEYLMDIQHIADTMEDEND